MECDDPPPLVTSEASELTTEATNEVTSGRPTRSQRRNLSLSDDDAYEDASDTHGLSRVAFNMERASLLLGRAATFGHQASRRGQQSTKSNIYRQTHTHCPHIKLHYPSISTH
eukprot:COSAG05_NODE_45_length_25418_cov_92.923299_21_plen_113_part_00